MDRRDFLTGTAGAGLGALVWSAARPAAGADAASSESQQALAELIDAIRGFEELFAKQFRLRTETDYAEARCALARINPSTLRSMRATTTLRPLAGSSSSLLTSTE